MKLQEMLGVDTLGDAKELSEGHYLLAYKPIGVGDELGHMRVDVLQVTKNGVAVLGGAFLFDRNPESPIAEIYKII